MSAAPVLAQQAPARPAQPTPARPAPTTAAPAPAPAAAAPAPPPAPFPTGAKVAFLSDANNLVPGDANATPDVFVKDMQTGTVTLASSDDSGTALAGFSAAERKQLLGMLQRVRANLQGDAGDAGDAE